MKLYCTGRDGSIYSCWATELKLIAKNKTATSDKNALKQDGKYRLLVSFTLGYSSVTNKTEDEGKTIR